MTLERNLADPSSAVYVYVNGPLEEAKTDNTISRSAREIRAGWNLQSELESQHIKHGEWSHSPYGRVVILDQREDTDEKTIDCTGVYTGEEDIPPSGRIGEQNTGKIADQLDKELSSATISRWVYGSRHGYLLLMRVFHSWERMLGWVKNRPVQRSMSCSRGQTNRCYCQSPDQSMIKRKRINVSLVHLWLVDRDRVTWWSKSFFDRYPCSYPINMEPQVGWIVRIDSLEHISPSTTGM